MTHALFPARWWAAAALLLSGLAQAETHIEHRVKSAFLFNFAKFVTWPEHKFAAPETPIEFCLRSADPMGPALAETLAGKTIDERPIVVRNPANAADWTRCHVAYLGAEPLADTVLTLRDLAGSSVLTVHEAGYALSGGVVRLYLEERKLRFEINAAAARREDLQLSSRLMSLATVVEK